LAGGARPNTPSFIFNCVTSKIIKKQKVLSKTYH
jgi:hypothetical protein